MGEPADLAYGAIGNFAMQAPVALNRQSRYGHVHFNRPDGVARIEFSSELSEEASARLDAFLRALIAEDEPVRLAQQEALQRQAMAAQAAAREKYMQMAQTRAAYDG